MTIIQIPSDNINLYDEFNEGNSVQIRVDIPKAEATEYKKGNTVTVVYKNIKTHGKIVSDPLEVNADKVEGHKILSLIVEKSSGL